MVEKIKAGVVWIVELLFKNPRIIPYLLGSVLILLLWINFKSLIPGMGPKVPKKPESSTQMQTIDWTDEAAAIDYVSMWLNANDPFVLTYCIPNKTPVKDCKEGIDKKPAPVQKVEQVSFFQKILKFLGVSK